MGMKACKKNIPKRNLLTSFWLLAMSTSLWLGELIMSIITYRVLGCIVSAIKFGEKYNLILLFRNKQGLNVVFQQKWT